PAADPVVRFPNRLGSIDTNKPKLTDGEAISITSRIRDTRRVTHHPHLPKSLKRAAWPPGHDRAMDPTQCSTLFLHCSPA
ncbi:MAG: hypothetical protein WAV72_11160, partial [Bradyrhizobium sp.]